MGTKRGKVPGSFIHDTKRQVVDFYRDVVQGLVAWQPRAPKLPAAAQLSEVEHPASEPPPFSALEVREPGEARDPDEVIADVPDQTPGDPPGSDMSAGRTLEEDGMTDAHTA